MKHSYLILIVVGAILVVLPLFLGPFSRNQTTFQENYHKAMDRLRSTQQHYTDHSRHEEALHQAADLEPSHVPGYLSQIVGAGLIVVGVRRSRAYRSGVSTDESASSSGVPSGTTTSA
jgi:hypothetical protein